MVLELRRLIPMVACALIAGFSLAGVSERAAGTERSEPVDGRPNIVMIVVDDMRFDEFGAGGHQYLETPNIDRLAAEGALFDHAWHATPLCSPNRASILTGQYASRHGILDNTSRSHASHRLALFPQELRSAGYRTAHVGKWHMGNDPTPRPGYDFWVSFAGQGRTNDPELYEDGRTHTVEGYITDIFTERAVDFIDSAGDSPFFVYIGHRAVHPEAVQRDDGTIDLEVPQKFLPAARHAGRYEEETIERAPSYGLTDRTRSSKPILAQAIDMRTAIAEDDAGWAGVIDPGISEETVRRRAEMMLAVDEGVGSIYRVLEERGLLDDTLIVFTSDNGYFYGEHGLTIERRMPYEEALRTPLVMRYPRLIEPGTRADGFTLSIDLAPTILDAAGVEIPPHIQGKSLVPLLSGESDAVRDVACMEYYSHENPMPWTVNLDYRIVRRGRYKYIRWIRFEHGEELYDLEADPYEQQNLADDPEQAKLLTELRQAMRACVLEAGGY